MSSYELVKKGLDPGQIVNPPFLMILPLHIPFQQTIHTCSLRNLKHFKNMRHLSLVETLCSVRLDKNTRCTDTEAVETKDMNHKFVVC